MSSRELRRCVMSLAMGIGGGLSPLLDLDCEDFFKWYQVAQELMSEKNHIG